MLGREMEKSENNECVEVLYLEANNILLLRVALSDFSVVVGGNNLLNGSQPFVFIISD